MRATLGTVTSILSERGVSGWSIGASRCSLIADPAVVTPLILGSRDRRVDAARATKAPYAPGKPRGGYRSWRQGSAHEPGRRPEPDRHLARGQRGVVLGALHHGPHLRAALRVPDLQQRPLGVRGV